MSDPSDQERWLDRLSNRVAAVPDYRQRQTLVLEAILPLSSVSASDFVRAILFRGMRRRDTKSLLLVEAFMHLLACRKWPEAQKNSIFRTAKERGDELSRLLFGGGEKREREVPDDEKTFPIPDYVGGRPLTLGERRSLAAVPNRKLLDLAVRDPHPMVVAKILDNPRITESDVVFISARRPAPAEALREVAIHPRWRLSKRVARALMMNPQTPPEVAITLLHTSSTKEMKEIMRDLKLSSQLRRLARELLRFFK